MTDNPCLIGYPVIQDGHNRTGCWVYRPKHPLADENGFVEKHLAGSLHARHAEAPMVISDLPEYRSAAADKRSGKRPIIGGRRQHREFLQRNGYQEVGNSYVPPRREEMSRNERISDIKRALGE